MPLYFLTGPVRPPSAPMAGKASGTGVVLKS